MNIDELKLGDLRVLFDAFGRPSDGQRRHPWDGRKVLVVLPHGFIYFGTLRQDDGWLFLVDGKNLRRWAQRPDGLSGVVARGVNDEDKVDNLPGRILINEYISMMEITKW